MSSKRISNEELKEWKEYHILLGLELGADEEAVKRAYRRKALELHPDKNRDNPNAEADFHAVKKASEALSDPLLRADFAARLEAQAALEAKYASQTEERKNLRSILEQKEKSANAGGTFSTSTSRGGDEEKAGLLQTLRQETREEVRKWKARKRDRASAREEGRAGPSSEARSEDPSSSAGARGKAPRYTKEQVLLKEKALFESVST
jgi:DnaJ homolog subfamily C member 17